MQDNSNTLKYAHFADLHLGSWRDQKMRDLSTKAFMQAMDQCIAEKVDFILFAGDLFNTSLPSLDTLKQVTQKLKELHDNDIPLYVIAGSHDFSPSGKTMIDVLEKAGLLQNVCKGKIDEQTQELNLEFTTERNTGIKITGIIGRKGQLDQRYYHNLHLTNLEQELGYKIFMFHTTVAELLPKEMAMIDSQPVSSFPKNFNYYAGGHIHNPAKIEVEGYGVLTYPGALFPNNFQELEKHGRGGYYLITVQNYQGENPIQQVDWKPLDVIEHIPLLIDCKNKTPDLVTAEINNRLENSDVKDTLITIRLKGNLISGKVSDVNFKGIFSQLYEKGAYFIMKNTAKLISEDFAEIKIAATDMQTIEEKTIKEHLQQIKLFDHDTELHLVKSLLNSMNTAKKEGETISDFQNRIKAELGNILDIKE